MTREEVDVPEQRDRPEVRAKAAGIYLHPSGLDLRPAIIRPQVSVQQMSNRGFHNLTVISINALPSRRNTRLGSSQKIYTQLSVPN